MGKRQSNTKSRIVSAAWSLFYEQGYESTTVEEIIDKSKTSKGSFYHYFPSKADLLGSLAYLFDEKYEELAENVDFDDNSIKILLYLNHELFAMIENSVDFDLLTRLYSSQLTAKGEKELSDHNRVYYKLLKKIILLGQERGEIITVKTASELVRFYAMCERSLIYDWCLRNGEYSLTEYADSTMPLFLKGICM